MVRTIIFLVFVSLMCCCSLVGLLSINMRPVQVRRMDSEVGIQQEFNEIGKKDAE